MRRVPFAASLLVAGLLAGACLGPDGPTGIGGNARAEISIAPALIPSPADAGALAIHRIRTVVRRVSDATVLGQSSVDVDPAAASWTLSLDVSLPSSPIDAMVTVVLLHVASGVESVEFSGVAGPLTLTAGTAPVRPDVQLVRGPLANVYTTGVTIPSSPDTLLEGGSVTLGAAATTSGSQPPTVFWTVLDSAVLSSAGDVVTGLAPGTGRVVASAGAFADTASIVVRPAPAVVEVTPDTVVVAGIGGEGAGALHDVEEADDLVLLDAGKEREHPHWPQRSLAVRRATPLHQAWHRASGATMERADVLPAATVVGFPQALDRRLGLTADTWDEACARDETAAVTINRDAIARPERQASSTNSGSSTISTQATGGASTKIRMRNSTAKGKSVTSAAEGPENALRTISASNPPITSR